jgi:hypothetical protein
MQGREGSLTSQGILTKFRRDSLRSDASLACSVLSILYDFRLSAHVVGILEGNGLSLLLTLLQPVATAELRTSPPMITTCQRT